MIKIAKKKEEELNPIVEEKNINISKTQQKELMTVAQEIKNSDFQEQETEDSDSFFRTVTKELISPQNISTKTEYVSIPENFAGTKLEFFSEFAYMPFLKNFVRIFEEKRVSLERKGRKEIILALQERHQEMNTEKIQNWAKMFNIG